MQREGVSAMDLAAIYLAATLIVLLIVQLGYYLWFSLIMESVVRKATGERWANPINILGITAALSLISCTTVRMLSVISAPANVKYPLFNTFGFLESLFISILEQCYIIFIYIRSKDLLDHTCSPFISATIPRVMQWIPIVFLAQLIPEIIAFFVQMESIQQFATFRFCVHVFPGCAIIGLDFLLLSSFYKFVDLTHEDGRQVQIEFRILIFYGTLSTALSYAALTALVVALIGDSRIRHFVVCVVYLVFWSMLTALFTMRLRLGWIKLEAVRQMSAPNNMKAASAKTSLVKIKNTLSVMEAAPPEILEHIASFVAPCDLLGFCHALPRFKYVSAAMFEVSVRIHHCFKVEHLWPNLLLVGTVPEDAAPFVKELAHIILRFGGEAVLAGSSAEALARCLEQYHQLLPDAMVARVPLLFHDTKCLGIYAQLASLKARIHTLIINLEVASQSNISRLPESLFNSASMRVIVLQGRISTELQQALQNVKGLQEVAMECNDSSLNALAVWNQEFKSLRKLTLMRDVFESGDWFELLVNSLEQVSSRVQEITIAATANVRGGWFLQLGSAWDTFEIQLGHLKPRITSAGWEYSHVLDQTLVAHLSKCEGIVLKRKR
ncbi:hypothetical protein BC830DRAFT_1231597 [Chytriomyces sp. MP71]|nr:hypothetical protein BC830DRAFT_1231597 [Chytriomyces sp. MP71]